METGPQPNTTSPSDAYWKIEVCENTTVGGRERERETKTDNVTQVSLYLRHSDSLERFTLHTSSLWAWYWPHQNTIKPRNL
jgi:hypothetical protein